MLIERNDIISWCHSYLRKIRNFSLPWCSLPRNVVYLDETWINVGISQTKVWRDTTFRRPQDVFKVGLTVGLKEANLRGPRFVLLYAGGEQGFIPNAKTLPHQKKVCGLPWLNGWLKFEQWFRDILLSTLTGNSLSLTMPRIIVEKKKMGTNNILEERKNLGMASCTRDRFSRAVWKLNY